MVHIAAADAGIGEIFSQVLRHLLRKSCDESALSLRCFLIYLADQVVDLILRRADKNFRVKKSRWADDLLYDLSRVLTLIIAGGC